MNTENMRLREVIEAHVKDLRLCAAVLDGSEHFRATANEIRVAVAELESAMNLDVSMLEEMREAWRLINAMAGQDYWNRAEDWLNRHEWARPDGAGRL